MAKYTEGVDYFSLKVNGVSVDVTTKSVIDGAKIKNYVKIPNSKYYVVGVYTNADWLKMSGIEKLGEVDTECDLASIYAPQNKSDLTRAQKEGQYPVTLYEKKNGRIAKVKWVFWSDIRAMAFEQINQKLSTKTLNAMMNKAPVTVKGVKTAVWGRKPYRNDVRFAVGNNATQLLRAKKTTATRKTARKHPRKSDYTNPLVGRIGYLQTSVKKQF